MSVRPRKGSPFLWYSFNINGHRFRGSTGKTAKREAEEVERDEYQRAKQSLRPQKDWTLQMVLSTYWNDHAKHTASAYHIEGNFADLQRILGKGLKTSELTDGALMDYRAKRRGEKRHGRYPKANTINREFAYLRAAYEHCRRFHKQALPDIDWKGLKAKEPPWRTRFADRDEFGRLMEAADPRLREIIVAAVATGLRRGNVLKLDWTQVQMEAKLITVLIKGNKEHKVRITPALMAVLSRTPPERRKGRVFDATNFKRLWYGALKDAGLENFRFHDLRHTFGSWARQSGADLAAICEDLNHSNIGMTLRYSHVKPDEAFTASDRVSQRLLGTFQGTEAEETAEKSGTARD